jgi:hypothetical protein
MDIIRMITTGDWYGLITFSISLALAIMLDRVLR